MKNLSASAPLRLKKYPAYKDSGVEWLVEIPRHWEAKCLRFTIKTNPVKSEIRGLNNLDLVSFVPMEAVGEYGGLALVAEKALEEVSSGYTYFQDGDVVVAKITPCFENGKGAIAGGLTNGIGFGTTELHVLRPKSDIDGRYLFYLSISHPFRKLGESEMYGAGGQKRVPEDYIRNLRPSIPPLAEQKTIASFLDRKTAEIDALIAKKRRMIELLQEKRIAVISHAVTKGLDPNAPMKDSGVEWLGEVPRHWDILPFTKYVIDKSDYRGATPEKVTDGIFLVTARNVRMGFIDYEASQEFVRHEDYDAIMRRGLPKKGDILFTTEAPLGNVALVDREDVALAQRIIRFRMNPNRFLSQFTLYAMMSGYFQSQLESLSTGSTAEGLKASKLTQLWLVVPPLPEQNSIADYIELETTKISRMVEKIETAIDKLLEYRTALISAAVTGKIDVRDEAA